MDLVTELEFNINAIRSSNEPDPLQAFLDVFLSDSTALPSPTSMFTAESAKVSGFPPPTPRPPIPVSDELPTDQDYVPLVSLPSTTVENMVPMGTVNGELVCSFPQDVFTTVFSATPSPSLPPSILPEQWFGSHPLPPTISPSVPEDPYPQPLLTPPNSIVKVEPWGYPDPSPPPPPTVKTEPQMDRVYLPTVPMPGTTLGNMVPVGTVNGELVYSLPPDAFTTIFTALPPPPPNRPKKRRHRQQDDGRPYIKKPPNAFMLYMKEQRPNVVAELKITDNARVNTELGQRWRSLLQPEKDKYFQEADKLRRIHEQQFPEWSTRDNYGKKRKRIRRKNPLLQDEEQTQHLECLLPYPEFHGRDVSVYDRTSLQ